MRCSHSFRMLTISPLTRQFQDLWPWPESRASGSQVDDGRRHVTVRVLVVAHAIRVSKTENQGNAVRVDEILCTNSWGHPGEPVDYLSGGPRGVGTPQGPAET